MRSPVAHPLALALPAMSEQEFAGLRDDIVEHGLRDPIVMHDDLVLDGLHRLRACEEGGVAPIFRDLPDGEDPAAFVISANLHRRHLSASQRAVVAAKLLPELEARARERQGARTDLAPDEPSGNPATKSDVPTKARDEAAQLVGVSPRYVSDAKRVEREAPDLAARVADGTVTLPAAVRELPALKDTDLGQQADASIEVRRHRAMRDFMHAVEKTAVLLPQLENIVAGVLEVDAAQARQAAQRTQGTWERVTALLNERSSMRRVK